MVIQCCLQKKKRKLVIKSVHDINCGIAGLPKKIKVRSLEAEMSRIKKKPQKTTFLVQRVRIRVIFIWTIHTSVEQDSLILVVSVSVWSEVICVLDKEFYTVKKNFTSHIPQKKKKALVSDNAPNVCEIVLWLRKKDVFYKTPHITLNRIL